MTDQIFLGVTQSASAGWGPCTRTPPAWRQSISIPHYLVVPNPLLASNPSFVVSAVPNALPISVKSHSPSSQFPSLSHVMRPRKIDAQPAHCRPNAARVRNGRRH